MMAAWLVVIEYNVHIARPRETRFVGSSLTDGNLLCSPRRPASSCRAPVVAGFHGV